MPQACRRAASVQDLAPDLTPDLTSDLAPDLAPTSLLTPPRDSEELPRLWQAVVLDEADMLLLTRELAAAGVPRRKAFKARRRERGRGREREGEGGRDGERDRESKALE